MSNTEIWDALGKTDPAATKGFKRAGGFSGTSTKPIWIIKRMTEQFGPAGRGWGVNEPKFETVHGQEGEVLVYCTVSVWHGESDCLLWGVGGDKVVAKRNNGSMFHDDEAFKKAFTDAVNNALKSLGMNADIHMGLFDDDKYVDEMRREFAEPVPTISDEQHTLLMGEMQARSIPPAALLKAAKDNLGTDVESVKLLPASAFNDALGWVQTHKKEAA